ncbi:unnamed protein product [Clonostachys rosea f. rosea IK726]|uniref:Uncharacterized protein n=1 Tax=Clonostachys rosea f. rosea IK726 TaxID=1349383 RepID=A0ACA9UIF4_BIOOC|nr:unnamed protein product [Clonostachys rosea f. rosea IK726]
MQRHGMRAQAQVRPLSYTIQWSGNQLAQEAGVSKKATKSREQGKKSINKDSTKRPCGRPLDSVK